MFWLSGLYCHHCSGRGEWQMAFDFRVETQYRPPAHTLSPEKLTCQDLVVNLDDIKIPLVHGSRRNGSLRTTAPTAWPPDLTSLQWTMRPFSNRHTSLFCETLCGILRLSARDTFTFWISASDNLFMSDGGCEHILIPEQGKDWAEFRQQSTARLFVAGRMPGSSNLREAGFILDHGLSGSSPSWTEKHG